jgi:DNA-binding LacI/PurR family transcriptional regulator
MGSALIGRPSVSIDHVNHRPTLEDVAALARVSRGTVSRVINGSPNVSDKAREAVESAIEMLRYQPNRAARALAGQRTDTVALVVSEPPTLLFTDPFFGGIVRGVGQQLSQTDHQLVLMMLQDAADHARAERYLLGGHVDGVLLLSLHGADPLLAALARANVPTVVGARPLVPDLAMPYVDIDNRGGARSAVAHLVERGNRVIATVAGPQDMAPGIDRLTGYREVIGARFDPSLVTYGDFFEESGDRAMTELLDRHPELDAVYVAADLMALGALRALRRAGRRVPEDVAVVGNDDLEIARHAEPPLTTVRQPTVEMGQEMARLLLDLTNGARADRPVLLRTELVLRDSA